MDGEKVTGDDSFNFSINAQLDSTPRMNIFGRKTRGRPRLFRLITSPKSSNSMPQAPISSAPPQLAPSNSSAMPLPPISSAHPQLAPDFSSHIRKKGEPDKNIVEDTNIRYLHFYKGEDICSKLYWYATNMQKNICVISATGSISEVTLQKGDNYLATIKYEGFYKVVTLAGLILPIKPNTTGSTIAAKQGGLMVSFEGEDGRSVNGLVSSSLIAYEKVEVLASVYAYRPGEYKTWEEMESSESIQLSSSDPIGSSPNFQSNLQWVTSTTNPVAERAEVTSNNRFVGQESSVLLKPKETPKDNQNRKVRIFSPRGLLKVSLVQGQEQVVGNDSTGDNVVILSEQRD
ncbi:AT-hook motif nuclear-localized protein 16-like [Impatiens glandulifera]|uniref:AT-hook motif nuclear-localized protein 16-like n=1 Tax=Impatiens glandulifera TaxID=253017 RepID=UPI001FB19662|nr:AT-hook motif nuclear-localized protein 16-like [Impatiens glandulifera]